MCSWSEEGQTRCLGIFDETVKRFTPAPGRETTDKVPHMGWNSISRLKTSLFPENLNHQFVYFVHSYYAETGIHTAAECEYIVPFSAALNKDNFFATQFHPEKSGVVGAEILKNFLQL